MKLKLIEAFVRSATFELENADPYSCSTPYRIELNGARIAENQSRNVFSIFDLSPSTRYEVTVRAGGDADVLRFATEPESFRLNIRDFGAAGDGVTRDTESIQAAVLSCPKGGTVLIPQGVYLTAPIFLKSDVTLEFEEGATLLGMTDRREYPILPGAIFSEDGTEEYYLGSWEGNPLPSFASLLTGIGVENVSVIGRGILDANAEGGDWWVDPKRKQGAWRPRMLFLNRCKNIRVQGVTFRNSYSWTIHPYYSSRIRLMDLSIQNHPDSPNTDGVDIESCSDVKLLGVLISVGDDCIALKSGKIYLGRRLHTATRNVEIRNCLLRRGHGALVIGSEISAGVYDVRASQCAFEETDRGLRIKTRRGRGDLSVVTGIRMEDIRMTRVLTPFVINMFYNCDPDGHSELVRSKEKRRVDALTPKVGSLTCRNIVCEECSVAGSYFYGLPEMPIESVRLENISIRFAEDAEPGYADMMDGIEQSCRLGLYANNVRELLLKNVAVEGYAGDKIQAANVEALQQ